jgi:hypothetical protein
VKPRQVESHLSWTIQNVFIICSPPNHCPLNYPCELFTRTFNLPQIAPARAAPVPRECTRRRLSFAARFTLRTADSKASTAAKSSRRRLDSGTGQPFWEGDPSRCVTWMIRSISRPRHCDRPCQPAEPPDRRIDDDDPPWKSISRDERDGLCRLTPRRCHSTVPWPWKIRRMDHNDQVQAEDFSANPEKRNPQLFRGDGYLPPSDRSPKTILRL